MQPLVSIDEIRTAAAALAGVSVRTPLVPFPRADPPLLVKPESLQPVGAFKLRGAYAAMSTLPAAARQIGVVTHSSGNHGQAVAYAAALLGMPAVVVVPDNAPAVKVAAIRELGAEIVVSAPGLAARLAATRDIATQRGAVSIPPFDDRRVIAGQGTIGLEIAADCPGVDLVVVPVGGGGLIAGVATAVRSLCPGATVIGVEPELAADARDSLHEGQQVAWPPEFTQQTIADALRVDQVGALPLQHMLEYVDGHRDRDRGRDPGGGPAAGPGRPADRGARRRRGRGRVPVPPQGTARGRDDRGRAVGRQHRPRDAAGHPGRSTRPLGRSSGE